MRSFGIAVCLFAALSLTADVQKVGVITFRADTFTDETAITSFNDTLSEEMDKVFKILFDFEFSYAPIHGPYPDAARAIAAGTKNGCQFLVYAQFAVSNGAPNISAYLAEGQRIVGMTNIAAENAKSAAYDAAMYACDMFNGALIEKKYKRSENKLSEAQRAAMGRNYKEANRLLMQCDQMDPKVANLRKELAVIEAEEKYREAKESFQRREYDKALSLLSDARELTTDGAVKREALEDDIRFRRGAEDRYLQATNAFENGSFDESKRIATDLLAADRAEANRYNELIRRSDNELRSAEIFRSAIARVDERNYSAARDLIGQARGYSSRDAKKYDELDSRITREIGSAERYRRAEELIRESRYTEARERIAEGKDLNSAAVGKFEELEKRIEENVLRADALFTQATNAYLRYDHFAAKNLLGDAKRLNRDNSTAYEALERQIENEVSAEDKFRKAEFLIDALTRAF
ncbi:MAG: hypothetical protein AABZ39_01925, partial [Spirochaetota bacterium]